jgi:hypothetical protein
MKVLTHLGQAAALILLIELFVMVVVFAAIAGGLAFGLHWLRGKTDSAFGKVNTPVDTGTEYVRTGLDYAAKPVIVAGGYASTVKGTVRAIQQRVRSLRPAQSMPAPEPVQPAVPAPPVVEDPAAQPTSPPYQER